MQKKAIGLLVLIATTFAACPANYNINSLVSDSVIFSISSNTSSSSQNYIYTFQQDFNSIPALALGLQDFSYNYLGPNSLAVYPSTITSSQITFNFQFTSSLWSKIKLNFFASTLPQLQLGNLKVENIQTSGTPKCAFAYANLNNAFGSSDNPVIRVFINGFDISSNSAQISVSPSNLQGTKITIKITVGQKTNIKRIWLSWLAFSPTNAPFGSYGGQVNQNKYSGSVSSDISNSLYKSSYILYGINSVSLNSPQALDFSALIDSDFVLTITASSLVDGFSLIYIVLGVLPSKVCNSCGNNFVACGPDCLITCPGQTYPFTYKDGGVGCRTCSNKLGMILSNGKCVVGTSTVSTTTTTTIIQASGYKSKQSQSSSILTQAATPKVAEAAAIITIPSTFVSSPALAAPINIVPKSISTSQIKPAAIVSSQTVSQVLSSTVSQQQNIPKCPQNAFHNGIQCVCQVGYIYQKGKCQTPIFNSNPISINSPRTVSPTVQSNVISETSNITTTISNQAITSSVQNDLQVASQSKNNQLNQIIALSRSSDCGPNSYNNGLGICVCNQGSYFSNGNCFPGLICSLNSHRAPDGSCICDEGYTNYSGICSKCPQGALWSSSSNKCIYVCGQNSAYSSSASACICNPGFGLYNSLCQNCPLNYFISKGYCVTCPVNSAYNPSTQNCDCLTGFFTNQWGVCARKCGTNQVYNSTTQACACILGLGRVNGACQICPFGSTPTPDGGSSCSTCGSNEVLINSKCVCQQGYAYNSANVCTDCGSLSNSFIVNGICAVCPGSLIYNGDTCVCPQGKIAQGSSCISQCQSDEVLDNNGNCYTCGINQIISNGACVCLPGYIKNPCGGCTLSCDVNLFAFQGTCATCPLNTIFNSAINGCSCPSGFYMDNYGVCQKLVLQPIACPDGQYFDLNTGCNPCSSSCRTCKSASQCITCSASGFSPNSLGVCNPTCGDGLVLGGESCDTGNNFSAGCISCQIQPGYTCTGSPSVCQLNNPPPSIPQSQSQPISQQAQPNSQNSNSLPPPVGLNPPLAQFGITSINSNNVFVSLKTNPTFTFSNPTQMQSFIQASFPKGPKPTVYCSQRNSPNLNIFDCLLIYPSGVPNNQFEVNFSYNFQGKTGSTTVKINPLTASNNKDNKNDKIKGRD